MQEIIQKADVLLEALPYIQRFRSSIFVVKYGGSFMDSLDPKVRAGVAADIVFLEAAGINPIVVHGGGKAITKAMELAGIKAQFVQGLRVTDEQTRETIKSVYNNYHVILEQHGAVGWAGLEEYFKTAPDKKLAICLETAHPAKFPEEIQKLLGLTIPVPESMKNIDQREGSAVSVTNDYNNFKNYLQKNLKIKE